MILADLSDTPRDFPRDYMSVRDARVYTCTRVLYMHDKLSCTRFQNCTIGASLMSVCVSASWNASLSGLCLLVELRVRSVGLSVGNERELWKNG